MISTLRIKDKCNTKIQPYLTEISYAVLILPYRNISFLERIFNLIESFFLSDICILSVHITSLKFSLVCNIA